MKALGFTIDTHTWVAYKGPRFNPTEWHYCFTDLESAFVRAGALVLEEFDEWARREEPETSEAAKARNRAVRAYEAIREAMENAGVR